MEEPWEFVQRKQRKSKSLNVSTSSSPSNSIKSFNTSSHQSTSQTTSSIEESTIHLPLSPTLPILSFNDITKALHHHINKLIDTGLCGLFQEILPAYLGYISFSQLFSTSYDADSDDDNDDHDKEIHKLKQQLTPRIICLGLGSFSTGHRNNNGIIQLATVLFLRRIIDLIRNKQSLTSESLNPSNYPEFSSTNINTISSSSKSSITIKFYDPIFTLHDQEYLKTQLSSIVYTQDQDWQLDLQTYNNNTTTVSSSKSILLPPIPTILIMPHCPLRLNALILQLLWDRNKLLSNHPLSSLLLIGNTLGTQQNTTKLGTADSITLLLNTPGVYTKIIPLDTCFNKPICNDDYIHSVYGIPWNSTSVHFFRITKPLGPTPSVYTKLDLE